MKAEIEVNLKPFRTPNFVLSAGAQPIAPAPAAAPVSRAPSQPEPILQDNYRNELPKYELCELSAGTLDKLCDDFRDEIFKKAGKEQPPRNMPV